jgi:hypothetical protein
VGVRLVTASLLCAIAGCALTACGAANHSRPPLSANPPPQRISGCAAAQQPGYAPGLTLVACATPDGPSAVTLHPQAGDVQSSVPLFVEGLDPADPPELRVRLLGRLQVFAVVTPRDHGDAQGPVAPPQSVLFAPIAVQIDERLHVDVSDPRAWTLSRGGGRILAAARPRTAL